MNRTWMVLAACLVAAVFGGTALAMEFSADMVNSGKGRKSMTSKVYMKDQKFRVEGTSPDTYTISRQDKMVTWVIMPKQKSYMEMRIDPSKNPVPREKMDNEISRKLLGEETVNGHPTKKYEVVHKSGKRQLTTYQWLATDMNSFPIKSAAADGSWVMEYRNIKLGGQSDSLFEVPKDYKKMAFPGMPGRYRR